MRCHRALKAAVRPTAVLALLGLLTLPAVAIAQPSQPSLAEIARQEAERRKTAKEAKIVITEKNLPESARKPASTAAPADANQPAHAGEQKSAAAGGAAVGGAPATPATPAAPAGDQGEALWRGRITQAREALRRNEVFLQALQTRVNSLATDYYGRDDPYQKMKLAGEREQAIQEMEKVKADIEASKKQVADIEEEARKAGVPPGWLR
jgi:hypothetical protein